jgi:hypothetical protein
MANEQSEPVIEVSADLYNWHKDTLEEFKILFDVADKLKDHLSDLGGPDYCARDTAVAWVLEKIMAEGGNENTPAD